MDLLLVAGCFGRLWFQNNIYGISTAPLYSEGKLDYHSQSYKVSLWFFFCCCIFLFFPFDIGDKLLLIFLHTSRTRFRSYLIKLYTKISTFYCQLISCTKNLVASIPFSALLYRPLEVLPVAAHSSSPPQKPLVKIHLFYLKEIKQTSHMWCGRNPGNRSSRLILQQAALWPPVHLSNLSSWAVHTPVGLSCSSIYFGCLPEKESVPGKCSWILQGGNRSVQIPWKSQWGHSEDQVHVDDAASAPHVQKLLRVTLLDLPTDREEHLRLRASPLTEELNHCKITATPCPQDMGNLEISEL